MYFAAGTAVTRSGAPTKAPYGLGPSILLADKSLLRDAQGFHALLYLLG